MSAFMQRVSSEVHEGEACVSQGSFSGWGVVWITSMVGILREDGICKFDTFLILLVMEKTLGYQMQIVSRLRSSVGSISGSNVQRDSRMRSSPSKPAPEMAGLPCWDERTRWMEPQEEDSQGKGIMRIEFGESEPCDAVFFTDRSECKFALSLSLP
jgi:hypothetical protein